MLHSLLCICVPSPAKIHPLFQTASGRREERKKQKNKRVHSATERSQGTILRRSGAITSWIIGAGDLSVNRTFPGMKTCSVAVRRWLFSAPRCEHTSAPPPFQRSRSGFLTVQRPFFPVRLWVSGHNPDCDRFYRKAGLKGGSWEVPASLLQGVVSPNSQDLQHRKRNPCLWFTRTGCWHAANAAEPQVRWLCNAEIGSVKATRTSAPRRVHRWVYLRRLWAFPSAPAAAWTSAASELKGLM